MNWRVRFVWLGLARVVALATTIAQTSESQKAMTGGSAARTELAVGGRSEIGGELTRNMVVYLSIDSDYYYSTPSHNEWRVWVKFQGIYPNSWLLCLDWEVNFGSGWANWDRQGYARISPDGNLHDRYQIRVKVKYNNLVTIYSDAITIGSSDCTDVWPGGDNGPLYGVCDL